MKTVKAVFVTLIVLAILVPLAGLAYIYSGVYDVGATTPHNKLTLWAIRTARSRSVATHSQGLEAPTLSDPEMIRRGFAHYREDCVACHAAPGVSAAEGTEDMYPQPPDLAEAAEEMPAEQLFWIIKHGLKMTGMPAWGPTHSDSEIWDMAAFLKQLPDMSAADYRRMDATVQEQEHHNESHHQ